MTAFYLHGFGSNASAFRSHWAGLETRKNPFFLDGPEHDALTNDRRWFPFTTLSRAIADHVARSAIHVENRIRSCMGNKKDEPITLIGHSQGAMIAFELVRRSQLNIVSAIAYAGFLPRELFSAQTPFRRSALSLSLYSSMDDHFVEDCLVCETADYFRAQSQILVKHYKTAGLPHGFSKDWLDDSKFTLVE